MNVKRTLIYLVLIYISSFLIYFVTNSTQSFWIIWSAFIFSLISLGETFSRRLSIIAIAALAAGFAAFISGLCAHSIWLLALYLFALTGLCIWFVEQYPTYSLLAFIVPVFAIIGGNPGATFSHHISKLGFILLGGLIVIAAQLLFARKFKLTEIQYWLCYGIDHLKLLANEIFSTFQVDYQDNLYLFERRIHAEKLKCLQAMEKVQAVVSQTNNMAMQQQMDIIKQCYDTLLECAALRIRVTDLTIFSLCTNELNGLLTEIENLFAQLSMSIKQQKFELLNTQKLAEQINRFEEINQNILQVTAPEPDIFVLFAASLKKLEQTFNVASNGIRMHEMG